MKTLCVILTSLVLLGSGHAENITQVGSWECGPPLAPNQISQCKLTQFDFPFAEKPKVAISLTTIVPQMGNLSGKIFVTVPPENITTTGFTPVVSETGAPGAAVGTYKGSYVAVGPAILHASAYPKYLVLSVVYAAPGGNGGKGPSEVDYQSGTTTGATTSASDSFKQSYSLSATVSGGFLGKFEEETSIGYSKNTTDEQSLDIKQSFTKTVGFSGPHNDGIDHNYDRIILWLNPQVDLSLKPTSVTWTIADKPDNRVLRLHVGWLNGELAMPDDSAKILKDFGITEADYCGIMKGDPLADRGPNCPDNPLPSGPKLPRYVPVDDPVAYQKAATLNDQPDVITINRSDSSVSTTTSTAEDSYTVASTLSGGPEALGVAKLSMKETSSWQWTNKSSQSRSGGTTSSVTARFAGPSFNYSGKAFLQVYLDTIYRTFAFAFVEDQPLALHGTLVTSDGHHAPAGTEVILIQPHDMSAGVTVITQHRAVTNANGEFDFYGNMTGTASIKVGDTTSTVQLPQPASGLTLPLK